MCAHCKTWSPLYGRGPGPTEGALLCYLSLIFKHSDTKWATKHTHSRSNFRERGACCAPSESATVNRLSGINDTMLILYFDEVISYKAGGGSMILKYKWLWKLYGFRYTLWCYMSLILMHSDTKRDKNNIVDQNLEGARACCAPGWIRHCKGIGFNKFSLI